MKNLQSNTGFPGHPGPAVGQPISHTARLSGPAHQSSGCLSCTADAKATAAVEDCHHGALATQAAD